MRISKITQAYNTNAYRKPWIAPVTLSPFGQVVLPDFNNPIKGAFVGNEGEAGELVVDLEAGSGVAFGQGSKREGFRGKTTYAIVRDNGTLQEVDRKVLIEHLVARYAAGHITPIEKYRASVAINAAINRYGLMADDCSDTGVRIQENRVSRLIQTMASKGVSKDARQAPIPEETSLADAASRGGKIAPTTNHPGQGMI